MTTHIHELVVDAIVEEQEINTILVQHNNPHEGMKIDAEQDDNVGDRLMEVPPTQEKHPTPTQVRYSFLKQKCPQLDE